MINPLKKQSLSLAFARQLPLHKGAFLLLCVPFILHSALCILHSAFRTLHSAFNLPKPIKTANVQKIALLCKDDILHWICKT